MVESNKGEEADFSTTSVISGTFKNGTNWIAHKVHIENLKYDTIYSYKVGGNGYYRYGVFKTDVQNPETITAIQLSDAQTKNPDLLNIWENTFAQAIETAGRSVDFVLYNGDQLDNNADKGKLSAALSRELRYSIARDTISEYLGSIPYMNTGGNHEHQESDNIQEMNNEIEYVGTNDQYGCYYSFDYGNSHFVFLNTNATYIDEVNWLKNDLSTTNKKWKIVIMHIGTYATGDHSDGSDVQKLIETLTPIFSEYEVDLVLQAHDHTYNKTLPYKWASSGYTTTYNNAEVVNLNPETISYEGRTYDYNPSGTYYVTTGAAGHRYGEAENTDGVWADVVGNNFNDWLYSEKTYLNNEYKIENGYIKYSNTYDGFTLSVGENIYHDQTYEIGDKATGNVNANMFGILNIKDDTLTYDFYTVEENEVKLFDSLNIYKD